MNGIISEVTSRSSLSSRQRATAIAAGVCLFGGFLAGLNIDLGLSFTNPFAFQTIDYSKINWIGNELNTREIRFSRVDESEMLASINVEFIPYELEVSEPKRAFTRKKIFKKRSVMFQDLQLAYERFEKAVAKNSAVRNEDVFFDFQLAAKSIRNDFITTLDPTAKPEVMIAAIDPQLDVVPMKPRAIEESVQMVQASAELPLAMKKWTPAPKARPIKTAKSEKREPHAVLVAANREQEKLTPSKKMSTQTVSIQKQTPSNQIKGTYRSYNEPEVAKVYQDKLAASMAAIQTTESSGLSKEEKQKLSESLLALRLESTKTRLGNQKQPLYAAQSSRQRSTITEPAVYSAKTTDPSEATATESKSIAQTGITCELIANHSFVKPNPQSPTGLDTQVCPEHREWISKEWNQTGWIKVSGPDHLSTLTLHPAANGGATLLFDANALAMVALKSGVRVAKGMGVIVGRVPRDYKIEFAGRGEETEYFEINHEKYFAIVNAEPGAGVIHLASEKNQKMNASVMSPVLEDTVTFLDLVEPQPRNIGIQVLKNGTLGDPEVTGLSVGISTQGMQAITQSDGRAVLKNVSVEPGYPLYIDVASKSNDKQGPNYRYLIKSSSKNGFYTLNQLSERTLYKWIKQLKTNLNDQSAMVVGFYNRKLLDGFKNEYQVRVMPRSNYYSSEPQNYTVLWNGKISLNEPLEGDSPRFMSVQIPEGLSQIQLIKEGKEMPNIQLMPISPRVIHVITE